MTARSTPSYAACKLRKSSYHTFNIPTQWATLYRGKLMHDKVEAIMYV